jgi:hypothetical protein
MNVGYQSLEALKYLLAIFVLTLPAFDKYILEDICSNFYKFVKFSITKEGDDNNEEVGKITIKDDKNSILEIVSVDICLHTLFSLFSSYVQTKSIYMLKYPSQFTESAFSTSDDEIDSPKHPKKITENIKDNLHRLTSEWKSLTHSENIQYNVAPLPSVSGYAFAMCAAILPLLKRKDNKYAAEILEVIRVVIPYTFEITNFIQHSTTSKNDGHSHISSQTVRDHQQLVDSLNKERFQHFVDRMEQVFFLHTLNSSSKLNEMNVTVNTFIWWISFYSILESIKFT